MNSLNHVTINGWMCNELELKGNELLVFALIYGFSQDGETRFYGSRNYIAKTFNISLPTVDKALNGLEEKNLIERTNVYDAKSGMHNEYNVCKEILLGVVKKLYGGSKETLHNNTSNIDNIKSNTKVLLQTSNKSDKPKKKNLYEKCLNIIDEYTVDGELRDLLVTYLKYRLEIKDKPLYANMWKGMINKLRKIDNGDYDTACAIVQQSINRGYLGFFPVSTYSSNIHDKVNESGASNVPHITKEEKEELDRMVELGELQEF